MIDVQELEATNVVEFTVDGRVTKNDFLMVTEVTDRVIARYGYVRLLGIVRQLNGIDPIVFWEDLKYVSTRLTQFSHVAVVSDLRWIRLFSKTVGKIVPAKVDTFRLDELDRARAWVAQ